MKPILLALLLAGCGQLNYRPNAYEWYPACQASDYYRWEVVDDPTLCGRPISDVWLSGWACAIQLSQGVIRPGDKRIDGGPITDKEGRLCVIFASMSEDAAKTMQFKWGSGSPLQHELKHCMGYKHREVFKP